MKTISEQLARASWATYAATLHGWHNSNLPPQNKDESFVCSWQESSFQDYWQGMKDLQVHNT